MEPFVVFDCEKVLPNRFSPVLATAARCRALHRGAQPRSQKQAVSITDLALREIGEDAFGSAELAHYLNAPNEPQPPASAAPEETCSGVSLLRHDALADS
jgi:DNA-directed RNA polymerase subunit omega